MKKNRNKQDWAFANPENVKMEQLLETANLPFSKKLEWLEQTQKLVTFIQSKRNKTSKND